MTFSGLPSNICKTIEALLNSIHADDPARMVDIAKSLDMSARTLRRHLARQHTSFTEILEKWRHDTAIILLKNSNLRVGEVAKRRGYSHPSNFERAFKRWTGHTPGTYQDKR
jgi:AraC-like DNA-binding protein